MSRLSEAITRGNTHHEGAQGSPVFIWLGNTYACSVSTERRGAVVVVGGKEAVIGLTLIVRQSVLSGAASLPSEGKIVMHAARTFRVLTRAATAGGATYEFDLGSPHQ